MTEAELILADIILLKIEPKTPFRMQRYLHNITIGLHDTQPENIYKEISQIVISNSSVIEDFLRTNGYIKFTDIPTHQYILTDEGEEAQKQGGHQQYLDWVAREKRKKGFEDFPKKKWHIYEPIKWAVFGLLTFASGYIVRGCNQDKTQDTEKVAEQPISPQTTTPSVETTDVHVLDSSHYQDTQGTSVATKDTGR